MLTIVTILTLITMTLYRFLDDRLLMFMYIQTSMLFQREKAMTEDEIRTLMHENGFNISNLRHAIINDKKFYEYDLVIKTKKRRKHTTSVAVPCGKQ
jgi:putative Mg2+ transporter-C (MgtC) family protein